MAALLGLLGGLGKLGESSPFSKLTDHALGIGDKAIDRETAMNLQKLINQGKIDTSELNIGGQMNLLKEQLGHQDKWNQKGLDSFKEAGLPGFSFFNGGGLNIGSSRSYIGGNNSVGSIGGPGVRLPRTGTSTFADLNGLSKPF